MKLIYKQFSKRLKVVVIDNIGGTYLPTAQHLTKYFDVYYHSVVQNPFPRMSTCNVGLGYDVKILRDFWSNVDEFDLFIFTDIYFSDWGSHLRKMGKMVWGGSPADVIETDRKLFKDELYSIKLDVGTTKYITGIENLGKMLKTSQDKWIKISYYRGDTETFHHINWRQTEVWLNELSVKMGPLGNVMEFMVEDGIDSIAEIGGDGYIVNGHNPMSFIWGLEVKDMGYVGKACKFSEMPYPIVNVYNKFRPVLQKYKHTGFYSTEIRVGKDDKDYYTDPCMREGSPPSNTYLEMISNWDEILIGGCKGELIEPKFISQYGVEIILKSTYCNNNHMPVGFDSKYKDNIKLKGSYIIDGNHYIIPFDQAGIEDMEAFGSVVVVGDNIESITNQALEIANSIDCYGLTFNENALDKAKESLTRIEDSLNVKF